MVLNYGLLFEEEHNAAFTNVSETLSGLYETDFHLSHSSLPHVTVLQFEADDAYVPFLWERLQAIAPSEISLDLAGLTFLPAKDGSMWIEISVLKGERIASAQEQALAVAGGARIINGVGDQYRPHITLVHTVCDDKLQPIRVENEVVRRKNVVGKPALGISGENYQFTKILYKT